MQKKLHAFYFIVCLCCLTMLSVTKAQVVEFNVEGGEEVNKQVMFDKALHIYTADKEVVGSPIIENGIVVLPSRKGMEVFELKTNKQLWIYQSKEPKVYHHLINEGIVYIIESVKAISAFDITTGNKIWSNTYEFIDPLTKPIVHQDRMFLSAAGKKFLGLSGKIFALNKKTGKEVWNFSYSFISIFPDMVFAKDKLILTSNQKMSDTDKNNLYIILLLDIQTGQILEKFDLPQNSTFPPDLAFDGKNIYCTYGFYPFRALIVYGLNVDDGNIQWQSKFEDYTAPTQDPILHEDRLYIFTADFLDINKKDVDPNIITEEKEYLYACDAKTGKILWQVEYETGAEILEINPVFHNEQLFFSSGNRIYVISIEDGEIVSSRKGEEISQLTIYEKKLFWADGKKLFMLNLNSI